MMPMRWRVPGGNCSLVGVIDWGCMNLERILVRIVIYIVLVDDVVFCFCYIDEYCSCRGCNSHLLCRFVDKLCCVFLL